MSTFDALCKCFVEPSANCCAPRERGKMELRNAPGLAVIRYRIGNFTTFRRVMLDDLASLAQSSPDDPFARWKEGTDGDYQTMFVELWAYLADVLTFYQERVANEAYLQTATQRDSLARLCRLIDYRPNPGAGASALLAFTVEKNKKVFIPAGFRAGNKPAPGKEQAVFETEAGIFALGEHSAIAMAAAAPTNQFAPLSDFEMLANNPTDAHAIQAATRIYPSAGSVYLRSFISGALAQAITGALAGIAANVPIAAASGKATRKLVLKGTTTRLVAGDYVLIVEFEGDKTRENATLRQLDAVFADKATNSTTISWTENAGEEYASNSAIYALRVTAGAFGSNAPDWNTLSPTLTDRDGQYPDAPFRDYWDPPLGVVPDVINRVDRTNIDTGKVLYLDAKYADAKGTAAHPGWVVLLDDSKVAKEHPRLPQAPDFVDDPTDPKEPIFHVLDVRVENHADFAMNGKISRLALARSIPAGKYPLRTTIVLTGVERLELQENLPLHDRLAGKVLILAGKFPQLAPGQRVMVRGKKLNAGAADVPITEEAVIDRRQDESADITTVYLKADLKDVYSRANTVLLANVASATQGETVKDEVLGNGNGIALQTFTLKKRPLTYLPGADADGLAAVKSTLQVTVNGVRWKERPTLFQHPADAQEYITRLDETGEATVIFGDGVFGAKPPTGKDNIRARYRRGMGANGNVAVNAVAQLLDNIPGLQKVTNPQATHGGLDRESADQIRSNGPASLRTFGRAVSARDYADLAMIFPGVAKASAEWVERDPKTGKVLAQPHVRLIVATADQQRLKLQKTFTDRLREFLDRRRDPNVPLRLDDCNKVLFQFKVSVAIDDDYPRNATVARVLAALTPNVKPDAAPGYFAFERLQLGQTIHLSDLYRTIQAIDGVRDAVVTLLRSIKDPDPNVVRDAVFVGPTELAELQNDPNDPNDPAKELVTWTEGGFVDT